MLPRCRLRHCFPCSWRRRPRSRMLVVLMLIVILAATLFLIKHNRTTALLSNMCAHWHEALMARYFSYEALRARALHSCGDKEMWRKGPLVHIVGATTASVASERERQTHLQSDSSGHGDALRVVWEMACRSAHVEFSWWWEDGDVDDATDDTDAHDDAADDTSDNNLDDPWDNTAESTTARIREHARSAPVIVTRLDGAHVLYEVALEHEDLHGSNAPSMATSSRRRRRRRLVYVIRHYAAGTSASGVATTSGTASSTTSISTDSAVDNATRMPFLMLGPHTIRELPTSMLASSSSSSSSSPTTQRVRHTTRIGILSDNQFAAVTFTHALTELTHAHQPHFIIHAGDAVQEGGDGRAWATDFFAVVGEALTGRPLLYTPGNHDYDRVVGGERESDEESGSDDKVQPAGGEDDDGAKPFVHWGSAYLRGTTKATPNANATTTYRPPYYATTIGPARFIMLNSNMDTLAQETWLEHELRSDACVRAAFRVVVIHIAPFVEFWEERAWVGGGERYWGEFIRKRYVPLFELHNVSLVISGHQHNYQRGARHGVTYTVVGGAGGTLEWERVEDYGMYEVTANVHHFVEMELRDEGGGREAELRWRAREVGGWFGGGRVIDEFVLRR